MKIHTETFSFFFCLLKLSHTTKKFFFYSLKSCGICEPQTEVIALNHSRGLKVSGRGDVIRGVAEVAWEHSEITGLIFSGSKSTLSITSFRLISSTPGLIWKNTLVLRCSPQGLHVVCVCESSPKPGFGGTEQRK